MSKLSPQRQKVVLLCCAVACMSGGPVLLRGHLVLTLIWIAVIVMLTVLVYAMVLLAKLQKEER